jgi:hypothetical protein
VVSEVHARICRASLVGHIKRLPCNTASHGLQFANTAALPVPVGDDAPQPDFAFFGLRAGRGEEAQWISANRWFLKYNR